MKITVHLVSDGPSDPSELLRPPDGEVERWEREPLVGLDFPCRAVGTFRRQGRPAWSEVLDGYFDVDWPDTVSVAVAVLARVRDRWFAVTFGQGRHLLRPEHLVADFGLRVTANSVPADRIRGLSSVMLDATSRRTQQAVAIPGPLRRFTIDPDGEWVRALSGETDDALTRGMAGSQSLSVDLGRGRFEVKDLPPLLDHLLDRYTAQDYRSHFPFIDFVVPLNRSDDRVPDLERELVRQMADPHSPVGVAEPGVEPGDAVVPTYEVRRGRRGWGRLDGTTLRYLVRDAGVEVLDTRVRGLDGDGNEIRRWSLREFLTTEISSGDETFVLAEGRWFVVDGRRMADLTRRLDGIEEFGDDRLDLPRWHRHVSETVYNKRVARDRSWLLLDREMFLGPDRRRDRIEICDLLTDRSDMVCVKRASGSDALSHLFGQGSVSATLFGTDRAYRREVERRYRERWPGRELGAPTVVYAIGTDRRRTGGLAHSLPFFSRINLVHHVRTVRAQGLAVAVARIVESPFEHHPAVEVPSPRPVVDDDAELALFDRSVAVRLALGDDRR